MQSMGRSLFLSISILALVPPPAFAAYDPAREYVEAPAVAGRYPDPDVSLPTPGFGAGRQDFTSHAEMLAFLNATVVNAPDAHVRIVGRSQQGRSIPLVMMSRGGAASGAELLKNGRPTLL